MGSADLLLLLDGHEFIECAEFVVFLGVLFAEGFEVRVVGLFEDLRCELVLL